MLCKRLILVLLFTVAGGTSLARAQVAADKIKRHQADMLYPIGSLVQSSKTKGDKNFIIGVLGLDPFPGRNAAGGNVNHLDDAAIASNANRAKTKRKRTFVRRVPVANQYQKCHILFVQPAQVAAALQIAAAQKNVSPVLLIGNSPGLVQKGIPVNFYEVIGPGGQIDVRLEFSPSAARSLGFDMINAGLINSLRNGRGRVIPAP